MEIQIETKGNHFSFFFNLAYFDTITMYFDILVGGFPCKGQRIKNTDVKLPISIAINHSKHGLSEKIAPLASHQMEFRNLNRRNLGLSKSK